MFYYYFKFLWRGKMLQSYYIFERLSRCRDYALAILDASRPHVEIYAHPFCENDILLETYNYPQS